MVFGFYPNLLMLQYQKLPVNPDIGHLLGRYHFKIILIMKCMKFLEIDI